MRNTGGYLDKNIFIPSTKLPQLHFYLHFLSMGRQNMTLSASAMNKHWLLLPGFSLPSSLPSHTWEGQWLS